MTAERLSELLAAVSTTRIAVVGDYCLDAYWEVDPGLSEVSVETGKATVPVRRQSYSLGGAGNVVMNLAALGVAEIVPVGVLGDDVFGRETARLLAQAGADTSTLLIQGERWSTPVYGKPYIGGEEQPRVDFGVCNEASPETGRRMVGVLAAVLPRVSGVIVNQQLPRGILTDDVIRDLNALAARHPAKMVVVDSRDRSERFHGVAYRLNAHEAARMCGRALPRDQDVPFDAVLRCAAQVHGVSRQPVFVSRGARGAVVAWQGGTCVLPGIQILRKTDPVGAGDTSLAATAACLAAGATPPEAGTVANFASAVTVQKVRTTGTASVQEILEIGASPDYVHRPELADDPRAAQFVEGTQIERVEGRLRGRGFAHAVFDHDGTISTLRQGWEPIMEAVCVRAILGSQYDAVDESVYRRVVERVRAYISQSTGIQTLKQMQMLAEMVREFGYVAREHILDAQGYKRIYARGLMERVGERLKRLKRRELSVEDFTVKGSVGFLQALRARGVRLYLASGTDHRDAVHEAHALGYGELFDGGIYGATDEVDADVKREVVNRILGMEGMQGSAILCFGDGPVEIREVRKRGGTAVGVASDEVRRYGLNREKRARLIRAGADLIVPDFSQGAALLELLLPGEARCALPPSGVDRRRLRM